MQEADAVPETVQQASPRSEEFTVPETDQQTSPMPEDITVPETDQQARKVWHTTAAETLRPRRP